MSQFNASALVLFSGGQDSATCLAWALERYERVETLGFQYDQRHVIELACREHFLNGIKQQFPQWAHKLDQDHMLDLSLLGQISNMALTEDKAQTCKMAESLGGQALVSLIDEETHTCYLGDPTHRQAWGYGCNTCPACDLRRAGHERYILESHQAGA